MEEIIDKLVDEFNKGPRIRCKEGFKQQFEALFRKVMDALTVKPNPKMIRRILEDKLGM